jgi:CBS domain-containing protein|uniref:CBS domain-containing protein n=1 Tax=Desulfobacca acetoxidans TaxID=60893 RepID=A0A7V6A4G3_9BACT
MSEMARDVMDTRFHTLNPRMTVAEAVGIFEQASEESGRRVFGMLVVDCDGRLVGMLSVYDIFLLLRPKHTHIWGEMADLDLHGLLQAACDRARPVLVGDIMTTDLITITPDTHLLLIIDIMIKKHVRRLPVLDQGRVVGIVYLSRVFDYLLARLGG